MNAPVLEVDSLSLEFQARGRAAEVLSAVSFALNPGETLCLVGESGCGKSMTALAIMRLIPAPGRIGGGSVRLRGDDLAGHDEEAMRRVRGNKISMIFQEPMTALNPLMTVGEQVGEVLRLKQGLTRAQSLVQAAELLATTGIAEPVRRARAFPHQLSGGQRQRAMIDPHASSRLAGIIHGKPVQASELSQPVQRGVFTQSLGMLGQDSHPVGS